MRIRLCALLLVATASASAQAARQVRGPFVIPAGIGGNRAGISSPARTLAPGQSPQQPNTRLLPDISAVGDIVADLSPKGSTQEDQSRMAVRELEIALQAVVDPYLRGDVFIGYSDEEGAAIEQAFLTTTALPGQFQARIGRFLTPMGKIATTHRHDLHTVEYPLVVQRLMGPEGMRTTGASVSRVFSPLGFYQELMVTASDRLADASEDLTTAVPVNKDLSGLALGARFRNYWDLTQAANLELSFSGVTGRREQPLLMAAETVDGFASAVAARQSLVAADLTYRWRPLQQGLYKSFLFQAEVIRQVNETDPDLPALSPLFDPAPGFQYAYAGPTRNFTGAYAFARWQLSRRLYLAGRADALDDPEADGNRLTASSALLEWYPSEFSKFIAQFERQAPAGGAAINRFLLQATFAIGPHKPHPF